MILSFEELRSYFEFLQKVFLGLIIRFRACFGQFFGPFRSCSLSDSPLSSHSKDARFCVSTKTHPKSLHDKFKTASKKFHAGSFTYMNVRISPIRS